MEKSTTTKSPSKPKTATKKPQAAPKAKAAKPVAAPVAEPAPVVEQPAVQPARPACPCQKVKNFFNKLFGKQFSILLIVLLGMLGLSQNALADITYSGGYIYFDNSKTEWNGCIQICGRQSNYTGVTKLNQVDNTLLWYTSSLEGSSWGGILGWFIIDNADCWSNGNFSETHKDLRNHTNWNTFSFNSGSTYYIDCTSGGTCSTSYISSGYSGISKTTATLQVQTRNSTGSYSTPTSSPATVTLKGTHMSGNGSTGRNDVTWNDSDTKYNVVITGKVTTSYTSMDSKYQFDGWYVDGSQVETGTSYEYYQSAATTVVAKFTRIKYTVTLNQESGSGGTASTTATYNSAMPTVTVPSRTGYTFGGYYTGTNGEGTKYYNADGTSAKTCDLTDDIELHAKWTGKQYNITLDEQGATTSGTTALTVTYGEPVPSIASSKPSRKGYTFGGYYSEQSGAGTQYIKSDGTSARAWNSTTITTLYAKWTPKTTTITLNNQGADSGKEGTTQIIGTYDAQLPTIIPPEKTGYTFQGYFNETGGTKYINADGTSARTWNSSSGTLTLYAHWDENKTTVTLSAGIGGTISPTASQSVGVTTSVSVTAKANDGYTWSSWFVTGNATKTDANPTTLKGNGNGGTGTLTAVFTEDKHTASIAYKCGDAVIKTPAGTSGEAGIATPVNVTAPDITGYTFSTWVLTEGVTSTSALTGKTIAINITADNKTIVASYTKNATFDLNVVAGEHVTTVTGSATNITLGTSYPISATAFATGYEFNNWTKKSGEGTPTFANANNASTTVSVATGSVDVQANAKPITYTITYIGVESSEHNNPATYNIETPTFNFATPTGTRTGYTFDKWNPGAINQGSWGHMNVTGYWTEHTYTIAFDGNGSTSGSTASISNVAYTARPQLTTNGFAKTGYKFAGWALTNDGAVVYSDGATITSALTADNGVTVTLYAKWTANQYNVTLDPQGADAGKEGVQQITATYDAAVPTINPTPQKTGYSFGGYYTQQLGAGTMYINGSGSSANIWKETEVTKLYAKWIPNTNTPYTVKHFKQNLDGTYPADPFATDNLTGTTAASVTPAVKTSDAITGFTAPTPQTVTILADGSLVVRYEYTRNSYNLTWDLAGGTAGTGTITGSPAKYEQVLYYSVNPSWTGYQFMGWNPAMTSGSTTMPANNQTYTATWQAKTYTLTLDNQGATTPGAASVTATYNAVVPSIAGNLPAKTGFTFDGYYTLADGGDQIIKADGTSTYTWLFDENKTLYAHWITTHVYLEGRARVKTGVDTYKKVKDTDNEWAIDSKNIEFTFLPDSGFYYLDLNQTIGEVEAYTVGEQHHYFRVGVANGDDGSVSCLGVTNVTNDYEFTTENTSATLLANADKSAWFNAGNAKAPNILAGPVMLKYNPSDANKSGSPSLSYCAPLLTLAYSGATATMSQMKIVKANATATPTGLTDAVITYQYKLGDGAWTTWNEDIVTVAGTYKLRAIASGNNEFGQAVENVISNEITVTVTTPAVSAQVTHVNGNPGSIIRINDSFTIKHTLTGVPTGQSVKVCYHWSKKPEGTKIEHDIFTPVQGDQTSVWTSIDVAGDYEIEVSISTLTCDQLGQPTYIKWQTYKLPIHVKGDEITVYARLDKGITDWEKKFVYYWRDAAGTWPGYKMSYIGKDSTDYEWYSYNINNYKSFQGGKLLFNDSTTRYGQYQTNNVDMPTDDEFYFIKTAMTSGKRDVALDTHIDVTRRVILTTDTTALYQLVTIQASGLGVFFPTDEEMEYTYTVTDPDGQAVALDAKKQFIPTKMGNYTLTIKCDAGTYSATNDFTLRVQANPLTLTPSVTGDNIAIGTSTTVTVSSTGTLPSGKRTYTVTEPGTNVPITFQSNTASNTSSSYTLLSSGTYTFAVVLTDNSGHITGKAQCNVTVQPKKYNIKHPFKNTASVEKADWVWRELTYNAIDGTYQYKGNDAYFHKDKVANISLSTPESSEGLKEYKIANPDNLGDNTQCVFVYDITLDSVTVYDLHKRLYRIKSVCQDNEYFSNAITENGQDMSFFAQKDGQLIWQERNTAADPWVDQAVVVTTTASESGIYTAKPDIKAASFDLTAYTGDLSVFTQLITNAGTGAGTATAANGKMTEFTKKSESEYYNHYWVRYVKENKQAMATVGNSINPCLAITLPYYEMPADGNVRYAYDNTTNHFSRAFLAGSGNANFLRVYGEHLDTLVSGSTYNPINSLEHSKKFDDGSDWIYTAKASGQVSSTQSVSAILVTKYNNMNRWVLAESGLEADPSAEKVVLSKDAATAGRYDLTLIYDYKTNRLTAGAQPEPGTVIQDTMVIDQLILSREGDEGATQFTLADKAKLIVVDKMTVEFDVTKDMWDNWQDEGKGGTDYKIMYFWFSVPYECHINEIYGLGVYGEKFEIQRYRGDLRAAGTAGGSTGSSAWRKLKATATMEANRGYVIAMRVAASDFKSATVGGVKKSVIRLFFPSVSKVELTHEVKTVLQQNESDKTSNLHWNWNIMGNPLVKSATELIVDSAQSAELNYVYEWKWDKGARNYVPWGIDELELKSTHSYMVQGHGDVYWAYPSASAPARYLEAAHYASEGSYGKLNLRLNISQDDQLRDKTYIRYREDGSRKDYEMGRDLEKIINSGVTQMYAVTDNNLAAICLNSEDTAMIPLTVIANQNGNYAISLHRQLNSNLEPTIYDAETHEYTNLSLNSFNVELIKGTYENRFFFLMKKTGVVTNLDDLNSNNYGEGVHKFIRNNQLYILRDGVVYDAQGRKQ